METKIQHNRKIFFFVKDAFVSNTNSLLFENERNDEWPINSQIF